LALREPSAVTEVIEKVLPKYNTDATNGRSLSVLEHARDMEKIVRALKTVSRFVLRRIEEFEGHAAREATT